MDAVLAKLARLESRIELLRREYDQFLRGTRRGEPTSLRDEVQREILRVTRLPTSSTAVRFQMQGLAHRFQALEQQVRNRLEAQRTRRPATTSVTTEDQGQPEVSVLLDRHALENPGGLDGHVRRLHRRIADEKPDALTLEALRERLFGEARRVLGRPEVLGVRFSVVSGPDGPKLKGEIVGAKGTSE